MARKKVTLQYIKNRAARRATFRKRRAGLLKKMEEICILCDAKGLAIIYDPEEKDPVVWPSIELAHLMLQMYWHMPEVDRCRKTMDHETFLNEQIKKIEEQLLKQQKINLEMKMKLLMHQICNEGKPLLNFDYEELINLLRYANKIWMEISKKVTQIEQPIDASSSGNGIMDEISSWLKMVNEHMSAPEQNLEEQWFMEMPRNNGQDITFRYADFGIGQQIMHPFLGNFGVKGGVNDMVIPHKLFEGNNSIGRNMGFLNGNSGNGSIEVENGLYLGNFERIGLSEGDFGKIGLNDHIIFPYDNNLGVNNTNGTNFGIRLPCKNFGGPMITDNNIGLGIHQRIFGRSNNEINVKAFSSNHEHI